jgi:DNA polymerase-4
MNHLPDRTIVHLDLDSFFVSVERLKDSRLKGVPLIIGGKGDRGVVSSCSYETRKFGVSSAMPIRLARQLCPHATVISGDFEAYAQYSQLVTDVIREDAPLYEKSSIDEFYIDASGMDRFIGCWKWASALKVKVLRESGLPISFGLAANKLVSKVATNEAKPDGSMQIPRGREGEFLAPMPVWKIPMIGTQTSQSLMHMGVSRVIELRDIPKDVLQRVFGKSGLMLWNRARGIDESPVVPYSEQKSVSSERTFSQDTIDVYFLRSVIVKLTEKIAFQLRKQHKLSACITVKVRYSNFDTITRQEQIAYTASDKLLARKALALFDKLYDRRLLVRLLGVRLSHLVYGGHQIHLFDDTEKELDLAQALDSIRYKYGGGIIHNARAVCY